MQLRKIFSIILIIQTTLICIIYLLLSDQPPNELQHKTDLIISTNNVNKFCEYANPIFNNSEAMKEIDFEWSIMKPRYDLCYKNNRTRNLHLACAISNLDLSFYDDKLLKQQLLDRKLDSFDSNLYKIKLDIEFLRLNLKFNTTPSCFAYRFDRIQNDDRYCGQVGALFKIQKAYDYELIVSEHGFYHIYCEINNERIFQDIKFILPEKMELLKAERQILIDMESKLVQKFKYDSIVFNEPIKECDDFEPENLESKMNVFILGLDSISLNQMKRMFPKTFKYLSEQLEHNVVFEHYHSVAENTFGNLIALFSGVSTESNQDLNITPEIDQYLQLDDTYFDTIPFLWKDYEKLGYLSWISEDYPTLGMFQYLRKGFRYKPSSVYLMPYWYKYEYIRNDPPTCHNNKHSFDLQFENLNHFFERMNSNELNKKIPYFMFNFMKFFTHDFFTFPPEYDTKLKNTIEELEQKGYLDNTLFVLMSDHGARTTSHTFITESGRTERSLPYLSIRLPKKLWNTNLERNLIMNKNKLVTHFDTFKTLRHFYYINKKEDFLNKHSEKCSHKLKNSFKEIQGLRGISLFEKIPADRSCLDALIPNIYCTCNQRSEMNEPEFFSDTNTTYEKVKELSMLAINEPTNKLREKCALFTFDKLLSARKNLLSSMFFYEFRFMVQPGDAIFAVYFRYRFLGIKPKDRVLEKYLKHVRLSKYGIQSNCMTNKNLMGYCYCKNLL